MTVTSRETELHWLALRMTPGLGTRKAGPVDRDRFRTPQAMFRASRSGARRAPASRPGVAQSLASGCAFDDAVDQQQKLKESGAQLISMRDPRYPPRLLDIFDPPPALFVRGRVELLVDSHARRRGHAPADGLWDDRCRSAWPRTSVDRRPDHHQRNGPRHRYCGPSRGARGGRKYHCGVRLRSRSDLSRRKPQAGPNRSPDTGWLISRVPDGHARVSAELPGSQPHH